LIEGCITYWFSSIPSAIVSYIPAQVNTTILIQCVFYEVQGAFQLKMHQNEFFSDFYFWYKHIKTIEKHWFVFFLGENKFEKQVQPQKQTPPRTWKESKRLAIYPRTTKRYKNYKFLANLEIMELPCKSEITNYLWVVVICITELKKKKTLLSGLATWCSLAYFFFCP